MDIKSKSHSQKIYFYDNEKLADTRMLCLETLYDFNHTRPREDKKRQALMKTIFAEVDDNCYIEPPLHANWGIHTNLGNNVYANFNLTLVDDTHIYIGDDVTLATAGHPIDPERRKLATQFNIPISMDRCQ